MRVVLDTNILVSALIAPSGNPAPGHTSSIFSFSIFISLVPRAAILPKILLVKT